MDEFKVGDRVRIVGDGVRPRHFLKPGTEVIITSSRGLGSWYIETDGGISRYVLEGDIEPLASDEDLDAQALELFGVTPPSHCPTCGKAY